MTRIELRRVEFTQPENFQGLGSTASLPYDNGIGKVRLSYMPEAQAVEVCWESISGGEVDPAFRGPALIPLVRVKRMFLPDRGDSIEATLVAADTGTGEIVGAVKRGPGRPPKNSQPSDLVAKTE